jgi:transposase-like protein
MPLTSPDRIEMNPPQQQRLRHLIRAGTTAQQLVLRARIVLLAAAGWTNTKIARRVGVCVDTVRKWRHRWWVQPGTASLGDAKRSGRPPSFTPVQVAAVKALACQPPQGQRRPAVQVELPGPGRAGRRRWDRRVGVDLYGATLAG